MSELPIPDAQERLDEIVDRARESHEPIFVTQDGTRVAAVIGIDELTHLIQASEDLADIQAAKRARGDR